jgi:hypothetical protein
VRQGEVANSNPKATSQARSAGDRVDPPHGFLVPRSCHTFRHRPGTYPPCADSGLLRKEDRSLHGAEKRDRAGPGTRRLEDRHGRECLPQLPAPDRHLCHTLRTISLAQKIDAIRTNNPTPRSSTPSAVKLEDTNL